MTKNGIDKPLLQRNAWIIGQAHNEEILRRHLAKHDVHVELNTELTHFEHNDQTVVAHVIKRNAGEAILEDISTPFLVGADGAASKGNSCAHFLIDTIDSIKVPSGRQSKYLFLVRPSTGSVCS